MALMFENLPIEGRVEGDQTIVTPHGYRMNVSEAIGLTQTAMIMASSMHSRLSSAAILDASDLNNLALFGLWTASKEFDPAKQKGSSFKSYAQTRIRGAMLDKLRDLDPVPRSVRDKYSIIAERARMLSLKNGHSVSLGRAARDLGMSPTDISDMFMVIAMGQPIALDVEFDENETGTGSHEAVPDQNVNWQQMGEDIDKGDLVAVLMECIDLLEPTERAVLRLLYWQNLRLNEVAKLMEVTESRVSQIAQTALLKIRRRFENKNLSVEECSI